MFVNGSVQFNGSTSYGTLGTAITFASVSTFTLELWYKGTESRTNTYGLGLLGLDSGSIYSAFGLNGGKVAYFNYNTSWLSVTSNLSVNDDKWHHVALVNSNNSCSIYIDGVLDITGNSSNGGVLNITYLMRNYSSKYTSGEITDIRIWNIVRSQSDIFNNMKKRLTGTESGLVAYWMCDEGTGTTLTNKVGTNNITLASTTWSPDFPVTTKYLLQDKASNGLLTINSTEIVDLGVTTLTEELYLNNGFDNPLDINSITFDDISKYKLLMYTDDPNINNVKLNYDCVPYKPIEQLTNPFKLLMYKG